jgi:hypothetical protein
MYRVAVDLEWSKFSTSALDMVNGQLHSPAALPLGNRHDCNCAGIGWGPRAGLRRFGEEKTLAYGGFKPQLFYNVFYAIRAPKLNCNIIVFPFLVVYIAMIAVAETVKVW